jgi:tetratricopeptide (TPR) repeat protein
MDKLDKLTAIFVIALGCYAAVLLMTANGQSQATVPGTHSQQVPQRVLSPELERKIQTAKNLLAQDSLEKSELLLNALLGEFPYEGELYLLKGDVLVRRQQPIAAMHAYREAIGLNPDFLDKKTRQFQGRKIKNTVEEALTAIESGLQHNPDDRQLRNDQKIVYFMKRKLAGSCG